MTRRRTASLAAALGAMLGVAGIGIQPGGATITGTSGPVQQIAPPPSVAYNKLESQTTAFAFNEASGVVLANPVQVDATAPGKYSSPKALHTSNIASGTVVDSHMVHTDPPKRSQITVNGSVTFDGSILGVIVTPDRLESTDSILGAPGTTYDGDTGSRGLELAASHDYFTISADLHTVSFRFQTPTAVDEMRVITAHQYNLSTTITDAPDPVTAGNDVQYTVTVTNNDALPTAGVQVTDTLPVPTFVSATGPAPGDCPTGPGSGPVTCSLGTLASGQSATVQIVVTTPSSVPVSGFITDQATATPGTNNVASQDTAIVAAAPGVGAGFVPPGGSITTGGSNPSTVTLPDTGTGAPIVVTQGPGTFCPGGCTGPTTTISPFAGYSDPQNPIHLSLEYDFPNDPQHPNQSLIDAANSYNATIYKFDGVNTVAVPACTNPGAGVAVPHPCVDDHQIVQPTFGNFVVTFEILYISGDPTFGKR